MSEWAPKRFWKEVSVETDGEGFAVKLDQRPVRTPAKRALSVPSQAMAARIAAEWEAQDEVIDPKAMPWTRSANAAIDKVAAQRDEVIGYLGGYADTDLLLYRAEGPEGLIARQREGWDPVLDWIAETYAVRLTLAEGVMPISQSPEAVARLTAEMQPMTDFQITGFHDLVTLTGSFALGLAAAKKQDTADALWSLSVIDETWQAEQWGEDDEAKEVAALKKAAFLHASDFFHSV